MMLPPRRTVDTTPTTSTFTCSDSDSVPKKDKEGMPKETTVLMKHYLKESVIVANNKIISMYKTSK